MGFTVDFYDHIYIFLCQAIFNCSFYTVSAEMLEYKTTSMGYVYILHHQNHLIEACTMFVLISCTSYFPGSIRITSLVAMCRDQKTLQEKVGLETNGMFRDR